MTKNKRTVLFIFRRDLRLADNTALRQARKTDARVICLFIYDPRQVTEENRYRSGGAIAFMQAALVDVQRELEERNSRLYRLYGKAEEIIAQLLEILSVEAVYCNKDYTPFSRQRDAAMAQVCAKKGVRYHQYADVLLHEPEDISTTNGSFYKKFTPYFTAATQLPVRAPASSVVTNLGRLTAQEKLLIAPLHVTEDVISILPSWGNFDSAAATLQKLKNHQEYAQLHDFPEHQTTLLSAHLKFGTLSIRQVYQHLAHLFGPQHPLIRQLYWRDFFTHIAYHAPHVFGHPFNPQYAELSWNVSSDAFERWCTGTTGFPLVDAGMRQLLETGYMHNRVRMVTASFLVKDLSIDWRCGERYFAQQLIDYDPALNNGNWQWVASTGCDSQPYFRIFNPWLQQKKFDPACTYIKQYVPELRQLSARQIHTWYTQEARGNSYPIPMLDHSNAAKATLAAYKKVVRKK